MMRMSKGTSSEATAAQRTSKVINAALGMLSEATAAQSPGPGVDGPDAKRQPPISGAAGPSTPGPDRPARHPPTETPTNQNTHQPKHSPTKTPTTQNTRHPKHPPRKH